MRYVVSSALAASLLMCCLRAATHSCADSASVDVGGFEIEYQDRKFYRAWDVPFVLTAVENAAHLLGVRSYVLHSAVLAVRLAAQVVQCAGVTCPDRTLSPLVCHGNTPCCNRAQAKDVVWAAPNKMCAMPPTWTADPDGGCAPLDAVPDLTICEKWGCSAKATPLAAFVVSWQLGTSAFVAVWYLFFR